MDSNSVQRKEVRAVSKFVRDEGVYKRPHVAQSYEKRRVRDQPKGLQNETFGRKARPSTPVSYVMDQGVVSMFEDENPGESVALANASKRNRVQQKKRQMWALYSLAKQNQGAAMRSSRSTSSLRSHIELRDTLEALRSEAMVGDTESTASSRASGGHAARKRGQSKLDKLTRETALMRKEQKSQRRV